MTQRACMGMGWNRIATGLAAGSFAVAMSACEPAAQVNLELDKTPAVGPLSSVVVVLRVTTEDTPTIYGPIDLQQNPTFRLNTTVPPGDEFYLDVFGCTDADTCAGDTIAARGCKDPIRVATGEERNVRIILYPSPGDYDLPPQPGVSDPRNGCPPVGEHSRPPPGSP